MTRDEQINLMKECIEDAGKVLDAISVSGMSLESRLAIAFFQYRAGQHMTNKKVSHDGIQIG